MQNPAFRIWTFLFSWLLISLLTPALAQEQKEQPSLLPQQQAPAPEFPGLSQVVPRAAELFSRADQVRSRIAELEGVTDFEQSLEDAEGRGERIRERIARLGELRTWNLDTLLEVRGLLEEESSRLQRLIKPISERLAALESLRAAWDERQRYWRQWQEKLATEEGKIPRETFAKALETIGGVLSRISDAIGPLVVLQEEITRILEQNQQQKNRIDAILDEMRSQTFEKTVHSFANPDFYRQFNRQLWLETREGFSRVQRIDPRFYRVHAWLIVMQALLALGLGWFIRTHRRHAQATPEWHFILRHPWATGFFVSLAGLGVLYANPPALWQLLMWFLTTLSAAILISALVQNPLKRFTVYVLGMTLVVTMALQIASLPAPLYRLYLALVCLIAIVFLAATARRNIRNQQGRRSLFTRYLQGGAVLAACGLFAQIGGYTALSARIVESSLKSVFLLIFIVMLIRLGQGGVEFLFGRPFIAERDFFSHFGTEFAGKLKNLLRVLGWGYGFFLLLQIWGVYDSLAQAWQGLFALEITIGQVSLTLEMVAMALLVLYLTIVGSWFIRAFLDAEIFPRQTIDRGVRDSIKKLLHYFLVFVGFLFAMSLAGLELKNFAVLAGALGIGIGFGLQNIVNNFFSGLILLFERPIKIGDILVIDDEWGTVKKIGLRSTVIETLDQSELIVPNSQFISEKVTNWTFSTTTARVALPVGVAYGSNIELVLKILSEAAETHPLVLGNPRPSPIFVGFGDSSLDFELRCWIADIGKRLAVRSDLGQYVDRRFREEGVEIPFPQRDLHLRSVDSKAMAKVSQRRFRESLDHEEKNT